jgi:hypothetical protein
MYDIFHLKLFKYWALEWRGTPSLLTRQNVFLPGVESAPLGWRTMDAKVLYIHKYKFVLCPLQLNWSGLKFNHVSVVGYSLQWTRMISDLYKVPFSRLSLKRLVCRFTDFLLFSFFRVKYLRLSLKVVLQFRLSALLIHNKTYFIRSEVTQLWRVDPQPDCTMSHAGTFIHSVVCLETCPEPLQNRVLQRLRAGLSSFKFQYLVSCLKAFSSCLRCLPRPFVLYFLQ